MSTSLPRTACVHLPDLAVAVARRDERDLAGRPLVVVAEQGGAARVVGTSVLARRAGVTRGMALERARALEPDLVERPVRAEACREVFLTMLSTLRVLTPLVEPADLDCAWLSIDGFVGSLVDARSFGEELAARVNQATGVAVRVGIAPGKLGGQIVTRYVFRRAAMVLPPSQARWFLGGLPLRDLPLGADRVEDLRRLGITRVGHFAALPARSVRPRFGEAGWRAYLVARGWDDARVRGWEQEPRLKARHRFPEPVANPRSLERRVERLAQRLGTVLGEHYRLAGSLRLDLTFASGRTETRDRWLCGPLTDPRSLVAPSLALLAEAASSAAVATIEVAAQGLCATDAQALARFHQATVQAGLVVLNEARAEPPPDDRVEPGTVLVGGIA